VHNSVYTRMGENLTVSTTTITTHTDTHTQTPGWAYKSIDSVRYPGNLVGQPFKYTVYNKTFARPIVVLSTCCLPGLRRLNKHGGRRYDMT